VECYLDLVKGPVFLRLGRQNLAWGETDLFRLLDGINPWTTPLAGPSRTWTTGGFLSGCYGAPTIWAVWVHSRPWS